MKGDNGAKTRVSRRSEQNKSQETEGWGGWMSAFLAMEAEALFAPEHNGRNLHASCLLSSLR
jgi:hypothetical protein